VILRPICQTRVLSRTSLVSLTFSLLAGLSQAALAQNQPLPIHDQALSQTQSQSAPAQAQSPSTPQQTQSQTPPGPAQTQQAQGQPVQGQPAQAQPAQGQPAPISNQAAVQATDGRYVPANGTIDGSSLKQFLNSGPEISATQMEEASIPADNLMQMPAKVDNRADARAQAAAQAQAQGMSNGQQNPHKKKRQSQGGSGFMHAISRPFVSTLNFLGFPVGLNDDVGIDSSLSSDLPESVRKRDGAYNPNVSPAVEATTNKYFGQ
jgi:hypothetical protein